MVDKQTTLSHISQYKRLEFWQAIFLRIYYLSLFMEQGAKNYYNSVDIPSAINTTIWTMAWIGSMPFVILTCLLIIKSGVIKQYLARYDIKITFRNISIYFFIISMILWIVGGIPSVIEIILFVILALLSEINFHKNKHAIGKLQQTIQ